MTTTNYKPGDTVDTDMTFDILDSSGTILDEIYVPAGNRIPPTRVEGAVSYSPRN